MSDADIAACAELFSKNYGIWAKAAGDRAGKQIQLSPARLKSMFVDKPDRFVAMMYDGDKLIGQAFYIRRVSPWHSDRFVTFVLQLVLDKEYRGKRFGLKILQSVFGLSNDDACGLYTSNPLTIRALEDATFRHIDIKRIALRLGDGLKSVLSDVFDDLGWLESYRSGCVNTNFFVGHDENERKKKKAYPDGGFPFPEELNDGEEWLAVVFRSQDVDVSAENMQRLTETSWIILQDAYSRMQMTQQKWAGHADREVEYLFKRNFVKPGDRVLDLGCGTGRHAIELAKRGCQVHGVDFASGQLEVARAHAEGLSNLTFEQADILKYRPSGGYDVVLCVYDVIGSSIKDEDARAVVKVISSALKPHGIAVVSVMNLELTETLCRSSSNRFEDIHSKTDFEKLMDLPPSNTMQRTGEVFKGQLLLLNPKTGVTYRREQFVGENELPTEYVIPDRRFTRAGLLSLFADYKPLDMSCVSAGKWDTPLIPTERHAKEVLGIFRKRSSLQRLHFLFRNH